MSIRGMTKHFVMVAALAICLAAIFGFWKLNIFADESGKAMLAGTEYDTLLEAVNSASDGDVITLSGDMSADSSIKIDKELTIDLDGNSINAMLKSKEDSLFVSTSALTIKDGELTSKNNTGRAVYAKSDLQLSELVITDFNSAKNGGAVLTDSSEASFNKCEFKDNVSSISGGAIYTGSSDADITNCTFENNKALGTGVVNEGGGALHSDTSSEVTAAIKISGSEFNDNYATTYGGAVVIDMYVDAEIKDSEFTNNKVCMGGGAIMLRQPGKVLVENNLIDKNRAEYEEHNWEDVSYRNDQPTYKAGYGGGLWIAAINYSDLGILTCTSDITLRGNTVSNNFASGKGGGLMLVDSAVEGDTAQRLDERMKNSWIHLESGIIEGNEADWGGGIDYTTHYQRPLILKNTLITGNEAVRGGGVWLCPQGALVSHSTLGGLVTGNTATGEMERVNMEGGMLAAHGNDIAHEGVDSKDVKQIAKEPAKYVTLTDRGFGGQKIEWYQDEAFDGEDGEPIDNRYSDEHKEKVTDIEGYPDVMGSTNLSFGVHGLLLGGSIADAVKNADLIIRNNIANSRGGGIAANSQISMGVEDEEQKKISVEKKWAEGADKLDSVEVELVRIDKNDDGEDVQVVIEKRILSDKNDWKYTFDKLPSTFEYTVREVVPEGWECDSKTAEDEEAGTVVTLTNTPIPEKPEEPEKPDKPDEPDTPDKPDGPNTPETPTTPENPTTPDEPTTPDTPTTTEETDEPEQPNEENTTTTDEPSQPNDNNTDQGTGTQDTQNQTQTTDSQQTNDQPQSDVSTSSTGDPTRGLIALILMIFSGTIISLIASERKLKNSDE